MVTCQPCLRGWPGIVLQREALDACWAPNQTENGDVGSPIRTRPRLLALAAGLVASGCIVSMVVLWPGPDPGPDAAALSSFEDVYGASIERIRGVACTGAPEDSPVRCLHVGFELEEGPDRGTVVDVEIPANTPRLGSASVGDRVVLGHQPNAPDLQYVFLERDRRSPLFLLAALFIAAVVILGRWKGVSALLGLAATFVIVFVFVVPAILDGGDPLLVSMTGSVAIAFCALYLSHGINEQTTVALLGTLGGLLVAALLATVFMGLATLTGLASEEALVLSAVGSDIDLRGLVLGGMLIGALGAIDDVTVTQTAAVSELRSADPRMPRSRLFRGGMRIGRDHVASTVNTLALAYVGASMPLLILFILSDQSAGIIANGEIVATEIVRTLVGSIGLVAAVPITTWLAASVLDRTGRPRGRHESSIATGVDDLAGPEEHPIPEHRRDVWLDWIRRSRSDRS